MRIIVPKHLVPVAPRPLFFLAGPIRGGGDWQRPMCVALAQRAHNPLIACPCRWPDDHPLAPSFTKGQLGVFPHQLDWEAHYLQEAATADKQGCIVFWLPCESKTAPHPGPEPYAMDTRGELGEWRWRMKTEGAKVVIGAEAEFPGLSQIQRNFSRALGRNFPIQPTLEATADAAIAIALH